MYDKTDKGLPLSAAKGTLPAEPVAAIKFYIHRKNA